MERSFLMYRTPVEITGSKISCQASPILTGGPEKNFMTCRRSNRLFSQSALARSGEHDDGRFDMGALAIRLSDRTNGVSKRHAEVVTRDWRWLIGDDALGITNGIHPGTWLGRSIERLLTRYVGEAGKTEGVDLATAIHKIPAGDLWRAHESQKELMTRRDNPLLFPKGQLLFLVLVFFHLICSRYSRQFS